MDSIDCRRMETDIDRLVTGELPDSERDRVEAHLDACAACREHHDLLAHLADAAAPEPTENEFSVARNAVLREIRLEARRARSWAGLSRAAAVALVAGAAVLVAAGWFAGRASSPATPAANAAETNPEFVLARQIRDVARENDAFEDIENSPFRYTNVQIEEEGSGKIRLAFDVARHLELVLPKSDPLVTEILVQSLLEEGSVGTKLQAIGQAENVLDPRIRGALVKAMLYDPNLGVRLQAQARLVGTPPDPETVDALLAVLETEESVQMRLVAIDTLTRSRVDPGRLERALEAGEPEGRGAVRYRARDYILSF
ncbi:MAG: anti-sigma factor family protein [Thermoanaerobaculia bacterium]